ncbi:MAG: class I SAM-dependent methyltransferase [Bacteroidales bacterium]|nr:class I SAM-dependent methyltransferase [Bacteroidales bacterium]
MKAKDYIKDLGLSTSLLGRFVYFSAKWLWLSFSIITKAEQRSVFLTSIRFGRFYAQRSVFTVPNRYPLLFRACADYLVSVEQPRIMSFGCSTGEEVFFVGEYIRNASIMGVDINRWCLKQCLKKYHNPKYIFVHRFSKELERASDFDAIFCLAVFQRTENRTNQRNYNARGFIFRHFEHEITMLDMKLRLGGLLVIDHSDFSFEDTAVSKKYCPLKSFELNKILRNRPLFDRNNQKIADEYNSYRVFLKYSLI